jgi:hypothetical protein
MRAGNRSASSADIIGMVGRTFSGKVFHSAHGLPRTGDKERRSGQSADVRRWTGQEASSHGGRRVDSVGAAHYGPVRSRWVSRPLVLMPSELKAYLSYLVPHCSNCRQRSRNSEREKSQCCPGRPSERRRWPGETNTPKAAKPGRGRKGAATRAKMAEAQKARWAKRGK